MVSTYDAAGAQARMIEVYLDREIVSMEIGQTVSRHHSIRNYGHWEKNTCKPFWQSGPDELNQQYEKITKGLNQYGIQQKQLMSAGALLLAYEIMNGAIFSGQAPALTPQEGFTASINNRGCSTGSHGIRATNRVGGRQRTPVHGRNEL